MARRRYPIAPADTYGRLTAIAAVPSVGGAGVKWLFKCSCGSETILRPVVVINGNTRSCGCLRAETERARFVTHGHCKNRQRSPEHRLWLNIKHRCLNSNNKSFHNYGGRGITICDKWKDDFAAFFMDVGARPTTKHSLGRIDNSRGYEPGNVRWETASQQARNRRNNKIVMYSGVAMPLVVACELSGVPYDRARRRLACGVSDEEALL